MVLLSPQASHYHRAGKAGMQGLLMAMLIPHRGRQGW